VSEDKQFDFFVNSLNLCNEFIKFRLTFLVLLEFSGAASRKAKFENTLPDLSKLKLALLKLK
jgi:hypothetical protein